MKRLLAAWSAFVVLTLTTLVAASPQIQPLDMQNYQIRRLAAGTASTDAARIGQTINSVTTSGTGLIAQTAASTWATRTLTATTDVTSITNGDGVSGNPTIDLAAKLKAGWIPGGTWTYASATTITVDSGAASKYSIGDQLELVQTTTKYFSIVGIADTVLTITGGTSYTLANAAITSNYYSHGNGVGHPHWYTWTPTLTVTAPFTYTSTSITRAIFAVEGKRVDFVLHFTGTTGGTLSNLIKATLPVTGSNDDAIAVVTTNDGGFAVGQSFINGTAATIDCYKSALANWTAGSGRAVRVTGFYSLS